MSRTLYSLLFAFFVAMALVLVVTACEKPKDRITSDMIKDGAVTSTACPHWVDAKEYAPPFLWARYLVYVDRRKGGERLDHWGWALWDHGKWIQEGFLEEMEKEGWDVTVTHWMELPQSPNDKYKPWGNK